MALCFAINRCAGPIQWHSMLEPRIRFSVIPRKIWKFRVRTPHQVRIASSNQFRRTLHDYCGRRMRDLPWNVCALAKRALSLNKDQRLIANTLRGYRHREKYSGGRLSSTGTGRDGELSIFRFRSTLG
jgi:hypothetical protein